MENKKYRGLIVVAPPHLNPKHEADRYVFSGVAVSTGATFALSLHVIALPDVVPPRQFAEDVTAYSPLPGDMELFAPAFDLGKFSYFRPSTGQHESARADAVTSLQPEDMHPAPEVDHTYGPSQIEPVPTSPQPEFPTPIDTF